MLLQKPWEANRKTNYVNPFFKVISFWFSWLGVRWLSGYSFCVLRFFSFFPSMKQVKIQNFVRVAFLSYCHFTDGEFVGFCCNTHINHMRLRCTTNNPHHHLFTTVQIRFFSPQLPIRASIWLGHLKANFLTLHKTQQKRCWSCIDICLNIVIKHIQ